MPFGYIRRFGTQRHGATTRPYADIPQGSIQSRHDVVSVGPTDPPINLARRRLIALIELPVILSFSRFSPRKRRTAQKTRRVTAPHDA